MYIDSESILRILEIDKYRYRMKYVVIGFRFLVVYQLGIFDFHKKILTSGLLLPNLNYFNVNLNINIKSFIEFDIDMPFLASQT